jgi:FecR protein
MKPHAGGVEPGLEVGLGEPCRRQLLAGENTDCSWSPLARNRASPHCVRPRSAEMSNAAGLADRLRSFIMALADPPRGVRAGVFLSLWAWVAVSAVAQSGACVLSPDRRNPNLRILRCGSELTITSAPGTVYQPAAAGDDGLPASVQLDSGALLIEFNSKRRHELQILTPQAVASVRGTKWAMEVKPGGIAGEVTVARKNDLGKVVVSPGQGVDISGLGTPDHHAGLA